MIMILARCFSEKPPETVGAPTVAVVDLRAVGKSVGGRLQ